MTRFRLATLSLLLAATATARADIIVEERPLTSGARPSPAAPVLAANSGAASPAPAPATAAPAGGTLWDQYKQVEQLQQQIQQLQGLVEQQGFLIERLQNDLRVRYTDLDQRLTAQQDQLRQQQETAATSAAATPAGGAAPTTTAEDEKRAYLAAYDTFRSGGPDKAIGPMLAFVKRYPNSSFVPSAYYWLGEFYLNAKTPDAGAARKQFDIVLANYPDSPKAPAALYKTGALLDLDGKPEEAKKRMKELLQKYPQSPEAALAQSYLDALEQAAKPVAEDAKPKTEAKPGKPSGKADSAKGTSTSRTAKATSGKDKKAAQTSSRNKN